MGGIWCISQEKTSQLISLPFFIICFLILIGEHLVKWQALHWKKKKKCILAGCTFNQLICISDSSWGLAPLGGMNCSLNTPGQLIMTTIKLIQLPLTEMKKSTTYNNISNHFPDTTLLSLYIVQKQESREKKLDGSNSKWHRGSTLSLFSL